MNPAVPRKNVSLLPFLFLLGMLSLSLVAFAWNQPDFQRTNDELRHPDYIGYGSLAPMENTLPDHLIRLSGDWNHLVGQKVFNENTIDPKQHFTESTLYLVNEKVVDDPYSIVQNDIRRYEVYHTPLPIALRELSAKNYTSVVRAFSRDYKLPERPFKVGGQILMHENEYVSPLPGIKVEVKRTHTQTLTDASGSFLLPADPQDTLLIHEPGREHPTEIPINGQEQTGLYVYSSRWGNNREKKRLDPIHQELKKGMSEAALSQDREAIQKELDRLKQASDSLKVSSLNEKLQTKSKTYRFQGKIVDAVTGKGIPEAYAFISNRPIAITANRQGNLSFDLEDSVATFFIVSDAYQTQKHRLSAHNPTTIQLTQKKHFLSAQGTSASDADSLSAHKNTFVRPQPRKEPLYVVDGVIARSVSEVVNTFTADDIKSIEMLNGPSATATYGANAANGVILITTRNTLPSQVIQGKVTDIETGQPVPGVNIVVKETTIGTVTDNEGNYSLTVPDNSNQLEFTSINYEPVTAHINKNKEINVQIGEHLEKSVENALFVVDGQIREDIRSFDDLDISKEDLKYTQTFKENRWMKFPLEYRNKGYTKVARIVTKNFQPQLAYRTVRGRLIDAGNGEPLVGAEIRWAKQGKKTVLARTDERGEYQVTLPKDANVIEYFHPGYTSREILDRSLVEFFPMHWTLLMRRKSMIDKKPSDFNRRLIVSPNPGNEEINVKFILEEAASVEFELLDKKGDVLQSTEYHYSEAGKKDETLSTSEFPADVYLLRITTGDLSFTRRILIE